MKKIIPLFFVLGVFFLFYKHVDLEPQIPKNFFFSEDNEFFKDNIRLNKEYPMNENQLFVIVSSKNKLDKLSEEYINQIDYLTEEISKIKGIERTVSITKGPSSPEDGISNPMWKRIIVSDDKKSSFVLSDVDEKHREFVVREVKNIIKNKKYKNVRLAGVPYFNEKVKENIQDDMKKFSITVIIIASIMLLIFFRSFVVLFLSLIICLTSSALTLVGLSFYGKSVGLLTANLLIISYVLALSHVIFLTYNIVNKDDKVKDVVKETFKSSFWCMVTTLLGFFSLIFVEAKPLIELGEGGVIAALVALFCVYSIFPFFAVYLKNLKMISFSVTKIYSNRKFNSLISILFLITAIIIGILGLPRVNTDPSLLTYFNKEGDIYKEINYLNKNGGSNPLRIEFIHKDNIELDSEEGRKKLWNLHKALKEHNQVGTIISLPVLMDETDEVWYTKIVPWSMLIDVLEGETFDKVSKSFISEDRKKVVFTMRMVESFGNYKINRLTVLEDLRVITVRNDFRMKKVGGTYFLQGKLAESVRNSLIEGLSLLCLIFSLIVLFLTRSFLISIFVLIFSGSIVSIIFGTLGLLNVPIDIISAPAINIAMGIAVDSVIHILRDLKRQKDLKWDSWLKALENQGRPAVFSMLTVSVGFSIFMTSNFPPSFRFGLIILLGILLSLPFSLNIIPSSSNLKK